MRKLRQREVKERQAQIVPELGFEPRPSGSRPCLQFPCQGPAVPLLPSTEDNASYPLWSQCCVCPCSLTPVTSRGPRTEDWMKQAANIYYCSSWFPLSLLVELPVTTRVHRIVTLIIFLGFVISSLCVLFLLSTLFWISVFLSEIIGF